MGQQPLVPRRRGAILAIIALALLVAIGVFLLIPSHTLPLIFRALFAIIAFFVVVIVGTLPLLIWIVVLLSRQSRDPE